MSCLTLFEGNLYVLCFYSVGNVMFIKSLSSIGKRTLTLKSFILSSYNIKEMSTLENVIDGLNDVKCRIEKVIQKRNQVFVYSLSVYTFFFDRIMSCVKCLGLCRTAFGCGQ